MARQLRQGGIQLSVGDARQLAEALQRDPDDLLRALTDEEKDEWRFYRASARHVTDVWRRVAEASTANGVKQRQLSRLLGLSEGVVSRALRGERKTPILNWRDAIKIAELLELPDGAERFVSGLVSEETERDR